MVASTGGAAVTSPRSEVLDVIGDAHPAVTAHETVVQSKAALALSEPAAIVAPQSLTHFILTLSLYNINNKTLVFHWEIINIFILIQICPQQG